MLERYELLERVGRGGMGSVWLARLSGKHGFEQKFAIKLIAEEDSQDEASRRAFLDEARITAAIRHPNVVRVVDFGEVDDTLFLVMSWVDGQSLRTRLGERVPVGVALRIVADACAGLHAAHELTDDRGERLHVVHRDVSPQNILLTRDGAAVVIDFGIAKIRDRRTTDTTAGRLKGKPRYLAPEQAAGISVDRRTDVWALGAVLFELTTGRRVHEGESLIDVVRAAMAYVGPPPLDDLPAPLAKILARALALSAADRHESAADLERELLHAMNALACVTTHADVARWLVGQSVVERPAPRALPRVEAETLDRPITGTLDTRPHAPVPDEPPGSPARPARTRAWIGGFALLLLPILALFARSTRSRAGVTPAASDSGPPESSVVAAVAPPPASTSAHDVSTPPHVAASTILAAPVPIKPRPVAHPTLSATTKPAKAPSVASAVPSGAPARPCDYEFEQCPP